MDKAAGRDIRLIALDLDGTTFTTEKKITENVQAAIGEAIRAGIIVMPATGRPACALPEDFVRIPGVRYALTSNGGAVWDLEQHQILQGAFMETEMACRVVDALLAMDALVEVYHSGICYADRRGYERAITRPNGFPNWFVDYVRISRTPVDDLRGEIYSGKLHIEKFLASFERPADRDRAMALMQEMDGINVSYGNEFNMEINDSAADKGRCLLQFAASMGITRDQVMACGDTKNDLTMMQAAGYAVAMGNASDEIRAAADDITLSNDEDGVAVAIRRVLVRREL